MGAVSCQWKMNVTKVWLLLALFPLQLLAAEIRKGDAIAALA